MAIEKKIALVGLGNAGGNIVKQFGKSYPDLADRIIINTSSTDMRKFTEQDYDYSIRMGELDGTGGNHDLAKSVAMSLMEPMIIKDKRFLDMLAGKQYVFVIGSAAGGTGSGMLPVVYQVISKVLRLSEKTIAITILPEEGLTVDRLDNTLLNQSELYTDPDATYMVYDNSRLDITSTFELKEKVNQEIVDDIAVFAGLDLLKSEYNNMDEEDMLALMSMPGRIVIVRCDSARQINHTDIESRILSDLQNRSAHAILNNDKIVGGYGLVANLTKDSIESLDESLPKIREEIGEPVSTYFNLSDEEGVNKVVFIMAGLAKPNARLFEINEVLTTKQAKIKQDSSEFEYKNAGIAARRRSSRFGANNNDDKEVSLSDIFSKLK